ncbi:MAG TPA: hypothetical protein VFJ06_06785, partial [Halococcus sp.]|nr:hypothetical protein [Halococcus sp.]
IGLLAFVFVETATPVTAVPRVLTLTIVVYTVYTVAGGIVFGSEDWFRFCDPLAVAFRFYGKVAPLRWTDAGLECRLPGAVLAETDSVDTPSVAFAIALIWELTFSGFINTQLGTGFIDVLVGPIPRFLVEFVFFVVGYAVFLGAYWLAARLTRNRIETYLTAEAIGAWMAPALLAIAAGYHLAHYFWLFFRNIPSLALLFASPFSPPANPLVFAVPVWSNDLNIAFILLGHLLAVWVAHARAYSLFPSRLQAIRSQFPFIAVMIGYTVASLWVISLV